jgi:hypothetical protein
MPKIVPSGDKAAEVAEQKTARTALAAVNATLDELTTGWTGLTAAAKLEAVRAGVVLALRILKALARRGL